jgi:hypothetical protein
LRQTFWLAYKQLLRRLWYLANWPPIHMDAQERQKDTQDGRSPD